MKKYRLSIQAKFLLCIALIFFPTFGMFILWEGYTQKKQSIAQIAQQAEVLCRQIIITRQWVADCGGIMAQRNSPGVGNVSFFFDDRINTNQGVFQRFTPSMVTKKLSDYSLKEDLYRFRLVSLSPMNPENTPNSFEKLALMNFEKENTKSMSRIIKTGKKEYYHYIVPLFADKSCLQCHKQNNLTTNSPQGGLSVVMPFDRLKTSLNENFRRRTAIGAAIFLLMLGTLFVMLRHVVVKPVVELEKMAGQIKEGNLDARIDIKAGDEFERLGTAFNTMTQKLAQSRETLEKRIDQATLDLSEANRELKSLDQLKSDFLANMSHELRSPLTVIRGGIDYLNRKIETEDNRNYLVIIDKNVARLTRLVTDLFDFTKLEAKKIEWSFEKENLTMLIEEVVEIINPIAQDKAVTINFTPTGDVYVEMDIERVEQVLVNLIENAIKFSDRRNRIEIFTTTGDQQVTVGIKDYGKGVDAKYIDSIFEKFSTVPTGTHSQTEGTGLGLAICKAIVEAHRGRIWVESEKGVTSTFYFSLPKTQMS